MKAKYFAIKSGFKTGIFYGTWSEYEGYVKGYSGAKFKSFHSKTDAEEYMSDDVPTQNNFKKRKIDLQPTQPIAPFLPAFPQHGQAATQAPSSVQTHQAAAGNSAPPNQASAKAARLPLSGDDQEFIVEFDGASRGNPGKAGCGAVVRSSKTGKLLLKSARRLRHGTTNNEAEYEGLILGLEEAIALGIQRVQVRGDSNLVVKQVCGEFKLRKEHLIALHTKVVALSSNFVSFKIEHVLREYNSDADEMSNYAIDRGDVRTVMLDSYL